MRIADVMKRDLPTVGPEEPLREAARRMTEGRVQALPVCEGERIKGILTDWDVTQAVATDLDAGGNPTAQYMTTDLVAAAPDAQLDECAELMADRRIHHLLVCDGQRFEGMVHLDVEWSQIGGFETPTASFGARI
jgi:CBS domain-containing protein